MQDEKSPHSRARRISEDALIIFVFMIFFFMIFSFH